MNAAFVILTSALLGNHPAAAPCNSPGCAPAPACATCDSGQSFGHRLRGQLTGLFSCNTCNTPAPCAAPAPVCATPAPCTTCGHHGSSSWGNGQLLGRLRGMFSHHSTCDSCSTPAPCDNCSAAPATATPATGAPAAPAGEAPKTMPKGDAPKGDAPQPDAPKGDKATRFEQTPEAPLAIPGINPVINTRPSVIVAPATLRNPF